MISITYNATRNFCIYKTLYLQGEFGFKVSTVDTPWKQTSAWFHHRLCRKLRCCNQATECSQHTDPPPDLKSTQ